MERGGEGRNFPDMVVSLSNFSFQVRNAMRMLEVYQLYRLYCRLRRHKKSIITENKIEDVMKTLDSIFLQ